jgi:hypothetical protein
VTSSGEDKASGPPDIEIGAAARAKRVRFRRAPDTGVRFAGDPAIESDSHAERTNLPEKVEPETTYRDVEVRWVAGARIADREDDR